MERWKKEYFIIIRFILFGKYLLSMTENKIKPNNKVKVQEFKISNCLRIEMVTLSFKVFFFNIELRKRYLQRTFYVEKIMVKFIPIE